MALTKAVAVVDAWAEVAQNAVREGAVADLTETFDAVLLIDCALSSTTAHTGTEIIVQVSSNTTGDEDWHVLTRLLGPVGTAVKADFAGTEAAGQTVLSVTNPATANVDNDGKFKFVEHTATAANSEIVFQTADSGDDGDTVTVLDGITNEQTADSDLFDIDSATASAVGQYVIPIPFAVPRARVVYNNTYDPDGSTVHTRCRLVKVTAIS
jgi:hypothetical protein